jgi:hypothetical protein
MLTDPDREGTGLKVSPIAGGAGCSAGRRIATLRADRKELGKVCVSAPPLSDVAYGGPATCVGNFRLGCAV